MKRYFPAINNSYGNAFVEMEEDTIGDYVAVDDILNFLYNSKAISTEELITLFLIELNEISAK